MSNVHELIGKITTQYESMERVQELRQALRSQSHRPLQERAASLRSTTHDNFLRGSLMGLDRSQHLQIADQVALRYWRYGHDRVHRSFGDTEREQMGASRSSFRERLGRAPVTSGAYEILQPGMGLEAECFSHFLTKSDKERAVVDYILNETTETKGQLTLNEKQMVTGDWLGRLMGDAEATEAVIQELQTMWTKHHNAREAA